MPRLSLFEEGQKDREKCEIQKRLAAEKNLYETRRNTVLSQLKALSEAIPNANINDPEQKLVVALEAYIKKLPQTKPTADAKVIFAENRISFASELLLKAKLCINDSDRTEINQFLLQEIKPFVITNIQSTELSEERITNCNNVLYNTGLLLFIMGFLGHMMGSVTFLFSLIFVLGTLAFAPGAISILGFGVGAMLGGLFVGGLGTIIHPFGKVLMSLAETNLPAETNKEVLERDMEERVELIGYAKELLLPDNALSLDVSSPLYAPISI